MTTGDPDFRLDVGSVLHRTLTVWGRNVVPFFIVGLVVYSPVLLGLVAIAVSGKPHPRIQSGLDLLSSVLTLILTGGVTYGVFHELRGRPTAVGDLLRFGLSRLGAVWAAGFLAGLGMGLGFVALVIPGLVLMARWWVAVPVAVIESPGASAAISRSTDLTEGNRWRIFGTALVVIFMQSLTAIVLGFAVAAIPGAGAGRDEFSAWGQALVDLGSIPVHALTAVTPSIVYHDLRVGKEGVDVEELLKVFE